MQLAKCTARYWFRITLVDAIKVKLRVLFKTSQFGYAPYGILVQVIIAFGNHNIVLSNDISQDNSANAKIEELSALKVLER